MSRAWKVTWMLHDECNNQVDHYTHHFYVATEDFPGKKSKQGIKNILLDKLASEGNKKYCPDIIGINYLVEDIYKEKNKE
jgi:hypothetical protein